MTINKMNETVSIKFHSRFSEDGEVYDTNLTAQEFENLSTEDKNDLVHEAVNETGGFDVISNESNENVYDSELGKLNPEFEDRSIGKTSAATDALLSCSNNYTKLKGNLNTASILILNHFFGGIENTFDEAVFLAVQGGEFVYIHTIKDKAESIVPVSSLSIDELLDMTFDEFLAFEC